MGIGQVTPGELWTIARDVGELSGWDFSAARHERDPVPWDYQDVVGRYVRPGSRVLDIGTGGGEQFLKLVPLIGTGTGIDASPDMVAAARADTPAECAGKVSFAVMDAGRLELPDASFDLVLNRHAPVYAAEIVRVLRPGGVFITQQVGRRNTQSIFSAFGWESNAALREDYYSAADAPPMPDEVHGRAALEAAFGRPAARPGRWPPTTCATGSAILTRSSSSSGRSRCLSNSTQTCTAAQSTVRSWPAALRVASRPTNTATSLLWRSWPPDHQPDRHGVLQA